MDVNDIDSHAKLDQQGVELLRQATEKLGLSMRAYHRIIKISRTIADLEESADIKHQHVSEAIGYRRLDRR
jgi:magnesium chelatase family protein